MLSAPPPTLSLCAPLSVTVALPATLPPWPSAVWVTPTREPTRTGAPAAVPVGTGRDRLSASRKTSLVAMSGSLHRRAAEGGRRRTVVGRLVDLLGVGL